MPRLGIAACVLTAVALAEGFTFTIGNPVAAQDFRAKGASFVFRAEGCSEPEKVQVTGTAEGLVKGARRSETLRVMAMSRQGVYGVYQNWAPDGDWIVNLKGVCSGANAGALVPIGTKGFIREAAKFFSRPATEAEIEMSLKGVAALKAGEGGIK